MLCNPSFVSGSKWCAINEGTQASGICCCTRLTNWPYLIYSECVSHFALWRMLFPSSCYLMCFIIIIFIISLFVRPLATALCSLSHDRGHDDHDCGPSDESPACDHSPDGLSKISSAAAFSSFPPLSWYLIRGLSS